ncbi:hypothetical protein C8F04DRAFT_1183836 [Mycena alexandri]|uniref:Uncharacterized protein n=1 Tax=Mycena alexandri TaxID=1745969 RepID=A0AAD6SVI6_9AGAR|nr:hypothetical protein C8F04DRAFT_1183836 [Mycena alexandri]
MHLHDLYRKCLLKKETQRVNLPVTPRHSRAGPRQCRVSPRRHVGSAIAVEFADRPETQKECLKNTPVEIKFIEPAAWLEIQNYHQAQRWDLNFLGPKVGATEILRAQKRIGSQSELWEIGSSGTKTQRFVELKRLEYIWSSKEMIVTWPTRLLAATDPDAYSCLYNKNFCLFKQVDQEADLIPDFALARCQNTNPWQPLVVLECATSQTTTALDRKVRWWLNDPKISLVIGVDIQIGQYCSPDPVVLTNDVNPPTFTLRDLLAMEFTPLGPININHHNWGCNIRKIMVGLHAPPDEDKVSRQVKGSNRSFDLTPVDVNDSAAHAQLLRRQETINRIVGTVVKDAMNPEFFDACFGSTQAFNLSWATAARTPVPSSSLKRALAEVDEDEATPLEVIGKPAVKRMKADLNYPGCGLLGHTTRPKTVSCAFEAAQGRRVF